MKKKILLSMGSVLLATTSTMVVVSCGPKKENEKVKPEGNKNKSNPEGTTTKGKDNKNPEGTTTKGKGVKPVEKNKGTSTFGTLLKVGVNKLLDGKEESLKKVILSNVDKILEGGISKVEDADLKTILKSFNVSDSLSGVILKLLKSDLLERVFVKGFGDVQAELAKENATYQDKKDAVKTFVESVLDAPKEGEIFTRELLTKLLVGFKDANSLSSTIINLLKKIGMESSGWEDLTKMMFSNIAILQKGLLGVNSKEIESSLNIITGEGQLAFITQMIGIKAPEAMDFNEYYSSTKNKDKLAQSIYSLIHGGLKALKGKDNNDLITFIENFAGKTTPTPKVKAVASTSSKAKDNKPSTTSSKEEATEKKPTTIETIANLLINNSESLYTFLKNGFSQDDWKELDKKLLKLLPSVTALL